MYVVLHKVNTYVIVNGPILLTRNILVRGKLNKFIARVLHHLTVN